MSRLTKKEYYLEIAGVVAKRSTCLKRNYGAVIVKDDRIISTGYNGAPRGRANCMEDIKKCPRMNVAHNTDYSTCRSVHAEANAIIHASYNDTQGSILYLTGWDAQTGKRLPVAEPCPMCKRMIINAQIEKVISWDDENHSVKEYFVKDWTLPCNDDSIPEIDGSKKLEESIKGEKTDLRSILEQIEFKNSEESITGGEGIPHLNECIFDLRSKLENIKFEYSDPEESEKEIKKRFEEAMSELYKDIIENGIPQEQEESPFDEDELEEIRTSVISLTNTMHQILSDGNSLELSRLSEFFQKTFSSRDWYPGQNKDRLILIYATMKFFTRCFTDIELWKSTHILSDNALLREKVLCYAIQGMADHGQPHTWNVDKVQNFQRMINNQDSRMYDTNTGQHWRVTASLCQGIHSHNYFVELSISEISRNSETQAKIIMDDDAYKKLLPAIRLMKILNHSPASLLAQLYGCSTVMENLTRMRQSLEDHFKK